MASNYCKQKIFSIVEQRVALIKAYPESSILIENRKKLVWYGLISPTAISKKYKVIIIYELNKSPEVYVIGDELEKLDAADFPHNYNIDKKNKMVKICIYRYREFSSSKILADTIVPWTVEWLYFYENWLATGKWLGGGAHPTVEQRGKGN